MNPLYRDVLPGGAHGSLVLRRGRLLRLTDVEGGANLALLAWNATEKSERLNLPDALKCQHTSKLTRGHCLYSDMGRVLLCITNDDLGWHDPMGGLSTAAEVRARYGAGDYQTLRNDFYRNGQDNLLVEMGKWGLSRRDLTMNVNFFSKLASDDAGHLRFAPDHSPPGSHVDLYAPMDTLVIVTAIQHPLDPATAYGPKPVALSVFEVPDAEALATTRVCRESRPENGRGFALTERYFS